MATLLSEEVVVSNYGGTANRYKFKLELVENSTNINNNTSNVTVTFYGLALTSGYSGFTTPKASVTVEGSVKDTQTIKNLTSTSYVALATWTGDITHANDGYKTIKVVGNYEPNTTSYSYVPVSTTISKDVSLTYIPRQANILTAPNFNDEQNPTITYENKAGNTTSTLQACISLDNNTANIAYRDISKTGTSYTFSLTDTERNTLRNATTTSNTKTVYFIIKSVVGSNTYYSKKQVTLTITNANPTFSATYQDTKYSGTTGNNQLIIQNLSTVQVNIASAAAKKGATLKSVSITCNNVTKNQDLTSASGTVAFGTIDSGTNISMQVKVIDSRNNSTTKTLTIKMLSYAKPNALYSISRKDNYYADTYIKVDGNISSVNGKNTLTISYRNKKTSTTTWSSWANIDDNTQYTISCAIDSAYNFQIRLVDKFNTVIYDVTLQQGMPIMFFDRSKRSIGVGKLPSLNDSLEATKANFDEAYIASHDTPIGTIQEVYNSSSYDKASGSWSDFTNVNLSLTQGTYVITFGMAFTANANGRRMIQLMASTNSGTSWTQIPRSLISVAPPNGANMAMAHSVIYQTSVNTQIELQGWQDSGSTITMREGYIRLVRIA